ncbi:Hypothetical predicted protein [Podarcis lilfordi]|uniref:Uncharacterized protein n=1 Tax=Podarcis lilfordi TaxID=74358 RepID=A0AA35LCB6_9SAUR|nr:Hypothetical predicted protein [Podarcis lilfordi]
MRLPGRGEGAESKNPVFSSPRPLFGGAAASCPVAFASGAGSSLEEHLWGEGEERQARTEGDCSCLRSNTKQEFWIT